MYGTEQKSQFIEFRAKGWSLVRIAEHLKISVRTLADWNQSSKVEIQMMRRVEMEALQEKILFTHEQDLKRLAEYFQLINKEMLRRSEKLQFEEARNLFRLYEIVRDEIQEARRVVKE